MNDGIILDANLLVLFVVGATHRSYIGAHKRLKAYSEDDFVLLKNIIEETTNVVVTPNTLTETSNLIRQIYEPARTEIYRNFVALINASNECYWQSNRAAKSAVFFRLGLTDTVLAEICSENLRLVTADFALYHEVLSRGAKVTNFNHLRELRGTV